jgi:hypothetical protein
MTAAWFFPAFFVFLLFGLYTWMLGGAAFGRLSGNQGLFRLPWLGYGLLLGLLQITHLFSAINPRFSTGFFLLSLGCAVLIHLTRATWRGPPLKGLARGWPKLVLLGVIAFLTFIPVFNACTKPAAHYDLGLYYLQEIRWFETFPIVRGVGNLILNLGFNQSAFLVTSLVDTLLPNRIGLWLVGGFLPWLGLTLSSYALVRMVAARKAERSSIEIAYAISLPVWIYTLLGNNVSSGSPDVTSSCLLIHLFLTFAAFIITSEHLERGQLFGDLWMLGALCVCVKLNTLGMVVGVCLFAVLFLIPLRNFWPKGRFQIGWSAAVAACLVGFWVYRGVLLSGYPLFPSRLAAVPVIWKVKESQADLCREDTVYWARIPYGDRKVALETLDWVKPWFKRVVSLDIQFAWPLGIGLVSSTALLLLAWMEKRLRRGSFYLSLLCAPLLLHTIFWLFTAPEPRYFGSTPWLFAVAPLLSFVAAEQSLAFLCALANLYLCAVPMAGLILETHWQWATPDREFPEIPDAKMAEYTNPAGLRYYAPTEGNQSFDYPLPCANTGVQDIGLLDRTAGIAGGFGPIGEEGRNAKR